MVNESGKPTTAGTAGRAGIGPHQESRVKASQIARARERLGTKTNEGKGLVRRGFNPLSIPVQMFSTFSTLLSSQYFSDFYCNLGHSFMFCIVTSFQKFRYSVANSFYITLALRVGRSRYARLVTLAQNPPQDGTTSIFFRIAKLGPNSHNTSHQNKAPHKSRSVRNIKGPYTSNFIRNSPDSASELCARSANAYMGTCGILCGTDGTSPIISNPNFFSLRKTLRMRLAI